MTLLHWLLIAVEAALALGLGIVVLGGMLLFCLVAVARLVRAEGE